MTDLIDCRGMEALYFERAKSDPARRDRWLGQAERWAELAKQQSAWRFQRLGTQQQMHTGPMVTQPNRADSQGKQMG